MKPLISEQKQKLVSVAIVTAATFAGFQALSFVLAKTFQLADFIFLAIVIYLFLLLWLVFLFDLHLKKKLSLSMLESGEGEIMIFKAVRRRFMHLMHWPYLRHYLNYLILPAIIYWSTVTLLALNPFREGLKQAMIGMSVLSLSFAYWYFKESFSKNFELHHLGIKILSLFKLLGAFLFFCSMLGFVFYFGKSAKFLFLGIFAGSFLLLYQFLFSHRLFKSPLLAPMTLISLCSAFSALWLYFAWSNNYFTGALVVLGVYNVGWGFLHHHLDGNLNRKLVLEYLLILLFILILLFSSHDFAPRII
jgi:hypothetical protein